MHERLLVENSNHRRNEGKNGERMTPDRPRLQSQLRIAAFLNVTCYNSSAESGSTTLSTTQMLHILFYIWRDCFDR